MEHIEALVKIINFLHNTRGISYAGCARILLAIEAKTIALNSSYGLYDVKGHRILVCFKKGDLNMYFVKNYKTIEEAVAYIKEEQQHDKEREKVGLQ